MKQTTAKTVYDALHWIHNNAHFESGAHWARGRSKETGFHEYGEETHVFYRNGMEKLLVPRKNGLARRVAELTEPNPRKFDSRMFRVNRRGRRLMLHVERERRISESLKR